MRESALLSQCELAQLISVSQARISRYETGEDFPPLSVALAYFVVFGRTPHSSFPTLYSSVEDTVMQNAVRLEAALRNRRDRASLRKRALLERMVNRASNRAGV